LETFKRLKTSKRTWKTLRILAEEKPKEMTRTGLGKIVLFIMLENMPVPRVENSKIWLYADASPALGAIIGELKIFNGIQLQPSYYNFLTCDEVPALNPFIYFQPFEPEVWLLIILAVSATFATHSFYLLNEISLTKRQNILFALNFPLLLTILSILLHTFVYSPSKVHKNKNLRIVLATWLLSSTVINNVYKGDNFAKTTAPTETTRVEKFEQLKHFTTYSPSYCKAGDTNRLLCYTISNNLLKWFQNLLQPTNSTSFKF